MTVVAVLELRRRSPDARVVPSRELNQIQRPVSRGWFPYLNFWQREKFFQIFLYGSAHNRKGFQNSDQFGSRPPRFQGVLPTLVDSQQAVVMEQEILTLLQKWAIERVSPPSRESGFFFFLFFSESVQHWSVIFYFGEWSPIHSQFIYLN